MRAKPLLITVVLMGAITLTTAYSASEAELPYVYTNWDHITVKDGLPNDHIFAVAINKS